MKEEPTEPDAHSIRRRFYREGANRQRGMATRLVPWRTRTPRHSFLGAIVHAGMVLVTMRISYSKRFACARGK